ncbi:MAG: hypothetical protein K0R61_1687, partial [Microvirga sp.]|nr:hypothetical protein [Microvirga sp.]
MTALAVSELALIGYLVSERAKAPAGFDLRGLWCGWDLVAGTGFEPVN